MRRSPPAVIPIDPEPRRRGFTVVEALVALTLFLVGALGVSATFTAVARLGSEARAVLRQARAMRDVVDSLRLTACSSLAAGSTTVGGVATTWTARTLPQHVQMSVHTAPIVRRTRGIAVEVLVPCE